MLLCFLLEFSCCGDTWWFGGWLELFVSIVYFLRDCLVLVCVCVVLDWFSVASLGFGVIVYWYLFWFGVIVLF